MFSESLSNLPIETHEVGKVLCVHDQSTQKLLLQIIEQLKLLNSKLEKQPDKPEEKKPKSKS